MAGTIHKLFLLNRKKSPEDCWIFGFISGLKATIWKLIILEKFKSILFERKTLNRLLNFWKDNSKIVLSKRTTLNRNSCFYVNKKWLLNVVQKLSLQWLTQSTVFLFTAFLTSYKFILVDIPRKILNIISVIFIYVIFWFRYKFQKCLFLL